MSREDLDKRYRKTAPGLSAYCRALARSEAEAQDLFQETWRRALERLDSYREDLSFGGWLASIARNLWIDGRRRGRTERKALEGMSRPLPEQGGGLRDLLEGLPESEREIVALYDLQGLSLKETAGVLGVTTWAVREGLASAHGRLARSLRIP